MVDQTPAIHLERATQSLVKVTPDGGPTGEQVRCIGFMARQIEVPDDFDRMGDSEIAAMFGAGA